MVINKSKPKNSVAVVTQLAPVGSMQLERENMKPNSNVRRLMFHVSENIQYMNQRFLKPITEMQHLELRLTKKPISQCGIQKSNFERGKR